MAMLTGQQNPNIMKDGGQNQQQHSRLSSMGGSSAHSLGPQTPQIYRQTKEQAAEANQMTGIPNTHYRGQLQFFNQEALNEESFLRHFGTNHANNRVVELSLNESCGAVE